MTVQFPYTTFRLSALPRSWILKRMLESTLIQCGRFVQFVPERSIHLTHNWSWHTQALKKTYFMPPLIVRILPINVSNNSRTAQVKWLDRGADRDEVLISISTDGRVTQWSITKGLEYTDLMMLKRVAGKTVHTKQENSSANSIHQVPFISRLTSGMSFDFRQEDPRLYIAGRLQA